MGVGTLIAAAIGLTKTIGAVVALAIDIGLSAVASKLFGPKVATGGAQREGRTGNVQSSDFPHQVVYGETRKGGLIFYLNGTGTDNEYLHLGVVLAAHECEEISEWYVNGELTQLDGSGEPTGNLAGFARFQSKLGTDGQTALADMVAENSNWSNDHRARGNCYFYARLKSSAEKWPSFIPAITVRLKGQNDVHDPRGAGSDGWSDNPALICADILERYLGVPAGRIDQASLMAAADVCDEAVDLADGSAEKRYRVGGFFELVGDPETWLVPWIAAMAGYVGEFGGIYYIHAGAWRAPEVTISEDDLRGGLKYRTSESVFSRSNGVKGVFASPQTHDQPVEFPPLVNAGYVAEDGGVEQLLELELEMVPSHAQAQRVAKIYLEENRRDEAVEVVVCLAKGLELKPWEVVTLDLATIGLGGTWRVSRHELEAAGSEEAPEVVVRLALKRHEPAVYDWDAATEEQDFSSPTTFLPGAESCLPQSPLQTLNANASHAQHVAGTVDLDWIDPDCHGTPTASGTVGAKLESTGTVVAATNSPATITLATTTAPAGAYVGQAVKILTGPGAGETKTITSYAGPGNLFNVNSNWAVVPTGASTYECAVAGIYLPGKVAADLVGNYIEILTGPAAGDIREILSFDDTAEAGICGARFSVAPTGASTFEVAPREYTIEIEATVAYEYRVTGSGSGWTPKTVTKQTLAIAPGLETGTVTINDTGLTDPAGYDFRVHEVTGAKARSKIDGGTWSAWVNATNL